MRRLRLRRPEPSLARMLSLRWPVRRFTTLVGRFQDAATTTLAMARDFRAFLESNHEQTAYDCSFYTNVVGFHYRDPRGDVPEPDVVFRRERLNPTDEGQLLNSYCLSQSELRELQSLSSCKLFRA